MDEPNSKQKFLFHRDVVIATVFTYLIIGMIALIFFNSKFLNPLHRALKDFHFTDFYYSNYVKGSPMPGDDIILVNIGSADRGEIGHAVKVISEHHPKVIGLDMWFPDLKEPSRDSLLIAAISGVTPIVTGAKLPYSVSDSNSKWKGEIEQSLAVFRQGTNQGFVNFLANSTETVRYYMPFITLQDTALESFTATIARMGDSRAYNSLQNRRRKSEVINYSNKKHLTVDIKDITSNAIQLENFRDKYVLIGFMGFESGFAGFEEGVDVLNDLHLTPMNSSFGGHAIPDMYGLEIHAHILQMILDDTYISELPSFVSYLIGFVITLLHMYVFVYFFVREHIWFHLAAKSFQLISFGILFFLAIMSFHFLNLLIEPALLLLAVVLSVDALYFLDGIYAWVNKNWNFPTYFQNLHH